MKYKWISSEIKPDDTGFYRVKMFDKKHNNTTYDIAYYDKMLDIWSVDDGEWLPEIIQVDAYCLEQNMQTRELNSSVNKRRQE